MENRTFQYPFKRDSKGKPIAFATVSAKTKAEALAKATADLLAFPVNGEPGQKWGDRMPPLRSADLTEVDG